MMKSPSISQTTSSAFTLVVLLTVVLSAAGPQHTTVLQDGRTHLRGQAIEYFPSHDTITSLRQARDHYQRGHFASNEHTDLNLGIARDNYWIRFALTNETYFPTQYVVLRNPRINDVEIFVLQNDSLSSQLTLGDNFPFQDRIIQFNQFAFPILFNISPTAEIYLFVRHKGNTLQLPIEVMNDQSFIAFVENGYLITGVTTGIFFITFFFGIFFLFNTRDRLFIYYSGYILSAGIWLWATEGYGFQYLWPTHPELATRLGPGLSGISACFFMASCLQFSQPYDRVSRFRKVLFAILILLFIWALIPFIPIVPATEETMAFFLTVYFSLNFLIAISMSAYLIWLSRKGYLIVLYYFFAVAVTLLCSFLIMLRGGGLVDLPFSTGGLMSIGYVIEIILMTAGITQQFYRYKQERENTLLAYLEQQKSITQKIVDTIEVERKRIGRELHDDIGSGLTQIALMSESARQYSADARNTKELNDIAQTTRHLVTNIGEIIWALNPANRTLDQLLIYLREQLNKLLEYSGMEYTIDFPPVTLNLELDNTQLRNLLLISKEVVNNSVKYSRATHLSITCKLHRDRISFEVSDDGIGMDLSTVKSRNGLRNIRLRAEEIGGTLQLESAPGAGTSCRYEVPWRP